MKTTTPHPELRPDKQPRGRGRPEKLASADDRVTNEDASLSTLPIDLKLLVLERVPTFVDLRSLARTCRSFRSTYEIFRSRIRLSVLRNEFGADAELKKESARLQRAHQLPNDENSTMKEVRKFMGEQYGPRYQEVDVEPWKRMKAWKAEEAEFAESLLKQNETTKILLHDHLTVLNIAHRFLNWRMDPDGGLPEGLSESTRPPTSSEIRRVVLATYRLWIILAVIGERPKSHPEIHLDIKSARYHYQMDPGEACAILLHLSFWDAETILWVYRFLLNLLEPYSRSALEQRRGDTKNVEAEPEDSFLNPDRFSNDIMVTHHLDGTVALLSYKPGSEDAVGILQTVKASTRTASWQDFFEKMIKQYEYILSFGERKAPRIRLFKGIGGIYNPFSCNWVVNHGADLVDRSACMFDDWRLEEWGYQWNTRVYVDVPAGKHGEGRHEIVPVEADEES